MQRIVGALALMVVGSFVPCAAGAQDAPYDQAQYRAFVSDALAEFDASHFDESLTLFERAYAIRPNARVLRGIAKVRFELRQYAECIATVDRALASQLDPLTPEMITEMTELRERASLFLGEASVSGQESERRTLEVAAGPTATSTVTREPTPVASPTRPIEEPRPATPHDDTLLYAGIGVGAVGVVVLAIGIGVLVDRSQTLDTCNGAAAYGARCVNGGTITGERDASIAPVAIGGALLIAGAVMIGVGAASGGRSDTAFLCAPTLDGAMCAGAGRW